MAQEIVQEGGQALARREDIPPAPAGNAAADPIQMLQLIYQAARDPTVDPEKMKTLATLARELKADAKEEEFRSAKVAALLECAQLRIGKRGQILNKGVLQSRYSRFEDIHKVVTPILAKHHLAASFEVGQSGQQITVRPILTHANGYQERGEAMPLNIDTTGAKNATQGAGSAASYGKRHTLKAMLNLIEDGEDDDGQSAGRIPSIPLTQAQSALLDEGVSAARNGPDSYQAWFNGLSTPRKGWLVEIGKHDEFKSVALKGVDQ